MKELHDEASLANRKRATQVLAAILAAIVILALTVALYKAIPPGHYSAEQEREIKSLFALDISAFYQENAEKFSYVLALLLFPCCYLLFHHLLSKYCVKAIDSFAKVDMLLLGALAIFCGLAIAPFMRSLVAGNYGDFPRVSNAI